MATPKKNLCEYSEDMENGGKVLAALTHPCAIGWVSAMRPRFRSLGLPHLETIEHCQTFCCPHVLALPMPKECRLSLPAARNTDAGKMLGAKRCLPVCFTPSARRFARLLCRRWHCHCGAARQGTPLSSRGWCRQSG